MLSAFSSLLSIIWSPIDPLLPDLSAFFLLTGLASLFLPHAIPVHGLGWGVMCVEYLYLHKLILLAVPGTTLKETPVPQHSVDRPVLQQDTGLVEFLNLSLTRRC